MFAKKDQTGNCSFEIAAVLHALFDNMLICLTLHGLSAIENHANHISKSNMATGEQRFSDRELG